MPRKNLRNKNMNDDEITLALAAMQSDSSEDDEDTEIGCRDGPYPFFDINDVLDKVNDMDMTLDELENIFSNKPSQGKASITVQPAPVDASPGPSLSEKPVPSAKCLNYKPSKGSFKNVEDPSAPPPLSLNKNN